MKTSSVNWGMRIHCFCMIPLLALAVASPVFAQEKSGGKGAPKVVKSGVSTPAAGSKLRTQLMDALRAWVKEKHKLEVIFLVESLQVKDGWAFAQVTPQSRDEKNKYEAVTAILRQGEEAWKVTDVLQFDENAKSADAWMADLQQRYPSLPADILPLGGGAPAAVSASTPAEPATAPGKAVGGPAVAPGKNDPVRAEIFDAIRPEIAEQLGLDPEKTKFEARKLLKSGDWVWAEVVPQAAGGKAKAEAITALLMKENDQWLVLELFTPNLVTGESRPDTVKRLVRQYPELPTSLLK